MLKKRRGISVSVIAIENNARKAEKANPKGMAGIASSSSSLPRPVLSNNKLGFSFVYYYYFLLKFPSSILKVEL